VSVAVQAGESKVLRDGQATVLARHDVVGTERKRVERRGYVAILTALTGAFSNLPASVAIHDGRDACGLRASRALDRIMARKFPTCR
jgi:hypothetical protein